MGVKNRAFVFIRPSANRRSIQSFVGDWLAAKNYRITARGNFSGGMEDEFEIQYANTGRKATVLKPYELSVPVEGLSAFLECFGLSWSSCLEEGLIRNAVETCDILDIDEGSLHDVWMKCIEEGKMVKLSRHLHCALIDIPDRPALFCINGHYLALRNEFLRDNASIHYFCVEWDDDQANWEMFKEDIIGSKDPTKAKANSLRGVIYSEWMELGLSSKPDIYNNAVHASNSAFEAFGEHLNWLKISINNDPLGCYMYQLGLTPQVLKDWLANVPIRGQHAFDYFEGKGSNQCIQVVQDIISHGEGIQSTFLRLSRGNNLDVVEKRRNACFLFIKPHANTEAVRSLTLDTLRSLGFVVSDEQAIDSHHIDKDLLIDKQYANIARLALFLSPKDYKLSAKSYIRFQKKFGSSWSDEIANESICNASEIVYKLEISHSQLHKAWTKCVQNGHYIKLEREFYCGYIDSIPGKPPLFCINGFYMAMRAQYLTANASIHCYTVEWEDDVMSWKNFLSDVVGSVDPDFAKEDSLRGLISQQWMELHLKYPLDILNNAIHASSSAFEAMVERSIWFKHSLKSDALFGKRMIAAGVPPKTLRDWSMNCIVNDCRVFDHMNNLGADDCIDKAMELLHRPSAAKTTETAAPVENTPQLPSIKQKPQSQSVSRCLNRRLFERALAHDYNEFASLEAAGFSRHNSEMQLGRLPLRTLLASEQQLYSADQSNNIQQGQWKHSGEKALLHSAQSKRQASKTHDRYLPDAASIHDSECEPNELDEPATSLEVLDKEASLSGPSISQIASRSKGPRSYEI